MRRAAWLVLAIVIVGGCKDKEREPAAAGAETSTEAAGPAALPDPTEEQIAGLIRGLDAVASAAPEMRVAFVAQLMHETVAADDPCFADAGTELTGDGAFDIDRMVACVQPCSIAVATLARLAPDARIAAIRTECKESELGVPAAASDLITPQMLLVARASRLLAHALSVAPADSKSELGERIQDVGLALPVPAWTKNYRLPTAPEVVARPVTAQRYVIIGEGDTTYHQAPQVRFEESGIEVAQASAEEPANDTPTAIGIPGSPDLHDTGVDIERQKGQYAMKSNAATGPLLARKQAIEQARTSGILGALAEQQQRVPDIMVLADAQTPAEAIVTTAQRMNGALLGVAGGGASAWALLAPADGLAGTGEQQARIAWTDEQAALVIAITGTEVVATAGNHGPRAIPRSGSAVDIEAVREVVREWRDSAELRGVRDIAIHVSGSTSYRDLVDVIAALAQDAPFTFYPRALPPGRDHSPAGQYGIGPLSAAGTGPLSAAGTGNVTLGGVSSSGKLDKNIIRRYIRRHLNRIRFCYEKQLVQEPGLGGKVVATFTITADGSTRDVSATGLHPAVDTCVADVLDQITFPKPTGGGTVNVTYPFVFRSAE